MDDDSNLPLFSGPHLPRFRFEKALDRLDLEAAVEDAPAECRDGVARMAGVLKGKSPARADLDALLRCRQPAWPPILERTWQRLVGRRLDTHGIPGTLDGEPAAAFLLRGGEEARAERSLRRHLAHHRQRHKHLGADGTLRAGARRGALRLPPAARCSTPRRRSST